MENALDRIEAQLTTRIVDALAADYRRAHNLGGVPPGSTGATQ